MLTTNDADKVRLVAGVTKKLSSKLNAGSLAKSVAGRLGGKGGGRPDMAQGGGSDLASVDAALAEVYDWVSNELQ